jgi:hypothetical protein
MAELERKNFDQADETRPFQDKGNWSPSPAEPWGGPRSSPAGSGPNT